MLKLAGRLPHNKYMRKTRNIRSLFPLKDKNDDKPCVIYKRYCSFSSHYIGETKCNAEVR